jgi:L-ascorbate metabolism protein UlaG (beta-lactamase superfamily)
VADEVEIRWLGHASAVIEVDGTRLLTDPALRHWTGPLRRIVAPVDLGAVRDIDAVLISHLHGDHAHVRSLRTVGLGVPVIAPRGAGQWLRRRGLADVVEIGAGETHPIGAVRLRAVHARHDGRRWPIGGPVASPVGFLIEGKRTVYFAGDTDLFDAMVEMAGRVDVALLPVAGWGPNVGPGHLNPTRAAEAAALIRPSYAIPIHWGTLAIPGRRPRDSAEPARAFARLAATRAPDVEVRVLQPAGHTTMTWS